MTTAVRQTVRALERSIRGNRPRVEKQLSEQGTASERAAVVFSAAKYYDTLKKLAKE